MALLSYIVRETPSTCALSIICLITLLKLGFVHASNVTCHTECVCLHNSTVDCSNKGLSSLPGNLPSNSSVLLLNQNSLETLSPQILPRLPLLKEINLSDNPINCNCSLSWILNASINFQIIGNCDRPDAVKGRAIAGLVMHEMCNLRLTTTASPVEKLEKETVSLNCQSSLPARVRWSRKTAGKPEEYIETAPRKGFLVLDNGTLVIGPLQSTDQGEYICTVEHMYGARANESVFLKVKEPLSFTFAPSNISLVEGESSQLDCVASGGSKVIWRNGDGGDLDSNHFKELSNGTLVISNAQTKDSGKYVCIIANDMEKKATVHVDVQATCKIDDESIYDMPTVKPTKSYYITNDVIRLSCVDGHIVNGSSHLICRANGTWDSEVFPKCQEIPIPTTPLVTPTVKNVTARMTTITPKERIHLMSLIQKTNGIQLNAESLRSIVKTLEEFVYRQKTSDRKETKLFLNVASNLMGKQNHARWAKVKQNFPGIERLLRAVNEAMKLQAMEMLKNSGNRTERFSEKNDNLDAEILVGVGEVIGKKGIELPSSPSPQDDYMEFPTSIFQKIGKRKVAVIVFSFKQLDKLLPKRSLITNFDSFGTDSQVLSGSIITLSGSLSTPITITFKNKNVEGSETARTKCVFWKYDKMVENFGGKTYLGRLNVSKGGWSDVGCNVSSRNEGTTTCQCDHLTDFVVLTSRTEEVIDPSVITYFGSIFLLIAALIAFIRNIVVWRQTRRERLLVLINECLAIILILVVFLLGVFMDYQQTLCIVLGALMHWFVLSIFFWILVEEIQLYLSVNFGSNRSSSRLKYFLFIGWVIPAIVVGIVLVITQLDDYGSTQWCWHNNSLTLLLSYICPIALCVLMSLTVIVKVAYLKAVMTDNTDKKDVSIILALAGCLIPLVAVTCITAALSADQPEKNGFQYLFALFCILLGIYILLYHCWLDREITKMSVRTNKRARPKRDYYSTKETVMYSPGTSEGKGFSLIFPSRKSPSRGKKSSKSDTKKSNKRSDSSSPYDYDSSVPIYPSINDSSLKSFRSQVSTQQHTLENPPNTLSAITISRPNSQCIELTSLSDLDRRPDGAEQTDSGEHSEFYGLRNSNPLDRVRQRTSGSSDIQNANNASTFGKDSASKPAQQTSDAPSNAEKKNRISSTSSAGISRSSVSGAVEESETSMNEDAIEKEPFLPSKTDRGPEVKSDPPAKIPKRRKKGSRRRLDDGVQEEEEEEETEEPNMKAKQKSSSLPSNDGSVKLKQYTGL